MANLDLLFNARSGITVGSSEIPIADNAGNLTPVVLSAASNINIAKTAWLQFGVPGNASPTLFSSAGVGFYLQAPDASATHLNIRGSDSVVWGDWSSTGLTVTGSLASNTLSTVTAGITGNLTVTGSTTLNNIAKVQNSTASTSSSTGALTVTGGVGIGGALFTGGAITAAGDVTAFSDVRLKTNIETVDNALAKVSQMRGVYFDKDGKRRLGVIAQEMQSVCPEVVEEGEYLSVAYGNIVGVLIEAIKELTEKVNRLESEQK